MEVERRLVHVENATDFVATQHSVEVRHPSAEADRQSGLRGQYPSGPRAPTEDPDIQVLSQLLQRPPPLLELVCGGTVPREVDNHSKGVFRVGTQVTMCGSRDRAISHDVRGPPCHVDCTLDGPGQAHTHTRTP
ncbi:hypothetical protein GCM10023159_29910 [Brevibacterium yomogidense]